MKKLILFACAFMLMSVVPANADDGTGEVIIFTSGYNHDGDLGNHYPKSPIQPPYVTYLDHTLYIWSQHGGFTLTLIDGSDNVVYQTYLFAGVQYDVLPATLSGTFTLILSDDTYLYTGVIDLE